MYVLTVILWLANGHISTMHDFQSEESCNAARVELLAQAHLADIPSNKILAFCIQK